MKTDKELGEILKEQKIQVCTREQIKNHLRRLLGGDIPITKTYIQTLHYLTNTTAKGFIQSWVAYSYAIFTSRNEQLKKMGYRERVRLDETTLEMAFLPELTADEKEDVAMLRRVIRGLANKYGVIKSEQIGRRAFFPKFPSEEGLKEKKPKKDKPAKKPKKSKKPKTPKKSP